VGVVFGKTAKAYPLKILDYHEAVNDRGGDVPFAVTYCPLCDSAAVFDRRTNDGVIEFGISGLLYNSNVLLYDRRKDGKQSLWSQMMTNSVAGPRVGKSLQTLPLELTTWADWSARHPKTEVLSTETGHHRDYSRSPYASYFGDDRLMFPVKPLDKRLPLKSRVLGVWSNKTALMIAANPSDSRSSTVENRPSNTRPSEDSTFDLKRVTVIIPALNEEASLPMVLGDLPKVGEVIVVDNGSTDRTAQVAESQGASVLREPQRGYGSACLRGLAAVRDSVAEGEQPPGIVAFVDADYSDDPDLLPLLVEPIQEGEADFVLGSRLLGERESGAMPPQSVYGNKLACFLMRLLFGATYTDLGPFRAIRYDALCSLNMTDPNFGWTVEMQIKATRAKMRTLEIPVPYRRRVGVSKISGTVSGTIKAGCKILYLIAKYGLRRRSDEW
jgi:hypothetical protein